MIKVTEIKKDEISVRIRESFMFEDWEVGVKINDKYNYIFNFNEEDDAITLHDNLVNVLKEIVERDK